MTIFLVGAGFLMGARKGLLFYLGCYIPGEFTEEGRVFFYAC